MQIAGQGHVAAIIAVKARMRVMLRAEALRFLEQVSWSYVFTPC